MYGKLDGQEIVLRLGLAVLAGIVLGLNRGARERPAGLRTTLLVCTAAALAMLQASVIWTGSVAPSVPGVTGDVLRLPLGVLSGMGFIGGGAIFRRGDLVRGVTTAATLWFATVVGLCMGGGQLLLGMIGLGIGLAVLWPLHWIEDRMPSYRTSSLTVVTEGDALGDAELRRRLTDAGLAITAWTAMHEPAAGRQSWTCRLTYRSHPMELRAPPVVDELARRPGTLQVRWQA
ncbi:MAG TPA: MgtC/SapB family protein [Acetobacteraceae bacterium]|nr:MgtC/SapB family protein [Acetobacteraceae bacterium]